MSLVWNGLSFSPEASTLETLVSKLSFGFRKPNRKGILQHVQGNVSLGDMVALLGPSGAGKSTLLNCLISGRNYRGCNGGIYVIGFNGETIRASIINQNEGEHLVASLTVAESLEYASKLKNPSETPKQIHKELVKDLIKELNLKGCENAIVEKCSGGEKKRLAIGLELAALKKPHFLFLDEPTSGLDSFVGFKVIKLLVRLAKSHNMAILTTIHQPSYKLLMQFDKAYILSGTGEVFFNGQPPEMRSVLENCGYDFAADLYENPADVALELASSIKRQTSDSENITDGETNDLSKIYYIPDDNSFILGSQDDANSETSSVTSSIPDSHQNICKMMVKRTQQQSVGSMQTFRELSNTGQVLKQENGLCQNETKFTLYTLRILLCRSFYTSVLQQTKFTFIKLSLHLVVAAVLAMLYNRNIGKADSCVYLIDPMHDKRNCTCVVTPEVLRGRNSDSSKNVSFQFFSLLFLMFASLMPTVLAFPSEIKLFLCEYRNSWYSTSAYYIAKTLTEIPFQLIFPSLYVYFLYWYSGQYEMENWYQGIPGFMASRYAHFLGVTILCCFIAQGLGFLIGIICVRSFNISIILSSSLLLFLFLFSGFFVKNVQMGESVSWLTYFSFVRFGLESLLIIIYGDARCTSPRQSSVLVIFDIEDDSLLAFNIWMLVAHLAATRFLAFVAFKCIADPAVVRMAPMSIYEKLKMFHANRLENVE